MTGRIIPLRGEPHERILALLPWFVTDRLDGAERAEVEAHLNGCADCRAEERLERRVSAQVASLPMDVEQSWARLRTRLDRPSPRGRGSRGGLAVAWRGLGRKLRGGPPRMARPVRSGPSWMGWAMAGQAALMIALLVMVWPRPGSAPGVSARYHALGEAPSARVGNIVVMFRPDTPERDLRAALIADKARLVDGPTAAGAYVLNVPQARRGAALTDLRQRAGVVMAEPIDASGAR